ncbi:MAG: carbohydrate binding domain-containing protein [Fibrobacter sp.]|nr:carbohydrate binding domain-containing protein [Fibrobacter sp.]
MKKSFLIFGLFSLLAANAFAGNAKGETLNGRSIYVYAPSGIEEGRPLLISCHGMNQDAAYQSNQARWEDVADTARFTVVYPNGEGKSWDISGDKDINLMKNIIDEMYKRYKVDLSRVYLSGFSMGGMFTYHAMGKIADKIAAFAPVSGYLMGGPGKASRPVPIIHHHGTSDDVVQYSGVMNHINSYKNQFNCPSTAQTETFPANSKTETWGPCDGGVSVKLVTLGGKGHWHSNDEAVIHTSKSIWNFVKNYSLDGVSEPIVVPSDRDSIFNGDFGDSLKLAGWKLNTWGGEASLKVDDGAAFIDLAKAGEKAYQIQMIQNGLHLENGQSYKLSFETWGKSAGQLEVNVEMDVDPYMSYLTKTKDVAVTTDKKMVEIAFTMKESTDKNGRVSFNAGLSQSGIYIDNVVLKKISASEVPSEETPEFASANFVPSATVEQFKVYDLKGNQMGVVKTTFSDMENQLGSLKLNQGIYMIRGKSTSRMVQVK